MANDLQDLMDTAIMPMALPVLREACVMPALVNTDFSDVAKQQNETIRVPLPQNMGEADDMDTVNGSSSTDLSDDKVDLKLDQWKHKQFKMTDKEMREVVTSGVLPSAVDAAVKSIANAINLSLLALYREVPYFAGTAGTTPSTADDIVGARKVLQDNLVPPGDRRLILDTEAEAKYLITFKDADKTGSTEALRNASLGRLFGFETFADQLAARHTPGTFATGSPTINGAVAAGATSMAIDGGAGTETLRRGDAFSVAGSPGQYVVTSDFAAAGGAITGVTFYPAAPAGGFADDAALTVAAPGDGSDFAINLAFHRDAFTFAARSLADTESETSTISVQTDPISGIPLRLETWREPGKATRFWRFDILYGVRTLRPELAARLHG